MKCMNLNTLEIIKKMGVSDMKPGLKTKLVPVI